MRLTWPKRWCIVLASLWFALPSMLYAQQAQLQASQAPHYTGVPIEVQIVADGFDEGPEPEVDVTPLAGARLTFVGVRPSVSTSVRIVNGQMTQWKRVRFVYRYQIDASAPGPLRVGPFTIRQGTKTATSTTANFNVQPLAKSDAYQFKMVLPPGPFWVGQRIPMRLEWWIDERSKDQVGERRARVPMFDQHDLFRFEAPAVSPQHGPTLRVDTASDRLELRGTVRQESQGKRTFLVVTFERTVIPLKAGAHTIEPSTLIVDEALTFSRNLFGERIPGRTRPVTTVDQTRMMTVAAPPEQGRPASFAGTMGRGFTIDLSADRTVVRTGDPITVKIAIRGDGAHETIALGSLANAGLRPEDFHVPEGNLSGATKNDTKSFSVTVRVRHAAVREIPALEFSWFNPATAKYEVARSQPIALSVENADVVSATDVVRRAATVQETNTPQPPSAPRPGASPSNERPLFSLAQADLAIETDVERLQRTTDTRALPWWTQTLSYGIGFAVIVTGWTRSRSANANPTKRQTQKQLQRQHQQIISATTPAELAGTLRQLSAELSTGTMSDVERDQLSALLEHCDNLAFAPSAATQALPEPIRASALTFADALVDSRK
ncbi:MAG: hypothetical protein ACI9W2_000917 [Gammaproteobacteria bacterium]